MNMNLLMRLCNTICNTIIARWNFRFPISDFRFPTSHFPLLTIAGALVTLSSCIAPQELSNFNEGPDFPTNSVELPTISPLTIQVDDLLSIKIKSQNEKAAAPYNLEPSMGSNAGNLTRERTSPFDYLVNQQGYIEFPVFGSLKLAGLTIEQAKLLLLDRLKPHLNDAIVIMRFTNFKVTLFGEVKAPGTYVINEERLTILEAIGMAGDLTDYANRRNILLVREKDGLQSFHRINLHDRSVFQSPYFYLQQNDVLYIDPLEEKTATVRDQAQKFLPWISVLVALTTLGITIAK